MRRSPLFLLIAVLGCAAPASQLVRPSTQLQTREFQTRTYETTDTPMVMKALLNVLQDDELRPRQGLRQCLRGLLGVLQAARTPGRSTSAAGSRDNPGK